jgi:O-methyltransferase
VGGKIDQYRPAVVVHASRRLLSRARNRLARVAPTSALRQLSMRYPPFDPAIQASIEKYDDYARLATLSAALSRLDHEGVNGAMAEVGVWRGDTSVLLNRLAPQRELHLFDTFTGFDSRDLSGADSSDAMRFRDTSADFVRKRLPKDAHVSLYTGRVPATLDGVSNERFAFVLLDLDLYLPTVAALEFFYPRVAPGGFLFLHDYNSPESDWACKRAMDGFIADKPERLVDVCDIFGSVLFRKTH